MRGAWQVVVEHRIEKTGGGAYRLKSADGRVDRKVTKRVVEELNLHYNVQADNPCSLLTQEAAKKFLHNGNEEDRYRFFLGAANLGTQKQDLMSSQARGTDPAQLTLARPTPRPIPRPRPPALPTLPPPNPPRPPPDHPTTRPHQRSPRPTQVNIQAMEEKTEKAQQRIPEFEEYARAAKEEYDGAVQLKELELMKEQMEPMVAWAQVAAKEREHAQLELDASTADAGVGQVQEKSDTLDAELAKLDEQKKAAERELGELFTEQDRLTKETQLAMAAAKEPQKAMKQAARNAETASADRSDAERALEVAKETLSHLETTLQDRQQALAAERAAKRRSCEEQMARSKKEGGAAKVKVDQLKEETERLEAAKGQHAEALAAAKLDMQRAAQELKDVSSKSANLLKNLHPNMPALVASVGKTSFRGPVVGPLGEYVKINEGFGHLALAAECALRGVNGLSAFVVTCGEDEKLLRKLAQSVGVPPMPMTIRPVEPRFKVPEKDRMKTDHTTLLDAITVSDDKMHNYFVDSFGSGQTLLFATGEEARQAVWEQARPPNAPNKLTGVMNDNQSFVYSSFAGGTQVRDTIGGSGSRGLLMADQAARKGFLEQQLQLRKTDLGGVEQQARQGDATLKQLIADEKKQRKELANHAALYRQANDGLKELEQTDADEALADLESARADVEQEQEKAERATADEEGYHQDHARYQAEYAPRKAKFDAAKDRVQKVMGEAEVQRKATEAFDAPMRRKGIERRKLDKELLAAQEGGAKKRKEAAEVAAYIQKFAPMVEKSIGPRVDDPEQRSVSFTLALTLAITLAQTLGQPLP